MVSSQRSRLEDSPASERVTVRLPAELVDEVEAAVDAGEFATRSQAIRQTLDEEFRD